MSISGSCLCGAVRFRIHGGLQAAGHCHCSMCRKSHGAAFASWAFVDPEQFHWTTGAEFVGRYETSPGQERHFCARCGSPLVASHGGEIREVVLAAIDGDPGVRPSEHIFVGSKATWFEITDTLPQFEAWPPGLVPATGPRPTLGGIEHPGPITATSEEPEWPSH